MRRSVPRTAASTHCPGALLIASIHIVLNCILPIFRYDDEHLLQVPAGVGFAESIRLLDSPCDGDGQTRRQEGRGLANRLIDRTEHFAFSISMCDRN